MRRHEAWGVALGTDLVYTLTRLEVVVDAEAVEQIGHDGEDPIPAAEIQRELCVRLNSRLTGRTNMQL